MVHYVGERWGAGARQTFAPGWSRRRVLSGLTAVAGLMIAPRPVVASEAALEVLDAEAAALFEQINHYRAAHGLGSLGRSARLDEAARGHALDMARHGFVSHTSSNGEGAIERIKRYYPYETWIGENVAGGYADGAAVLQAWRTSSGHNAILSQPEFQVVGLAGVRNEATRHRWFWVADFGGQADE